MKAAMSSTPDLAKILISWNADVSVKDSQVGGCAPANANSCTLLFSCTQL